MVDFCGLSQQKYANMLEKLGFYDGLNDGFNVLLTSFNREKHVVCLRSEEEIKQN